MLGVALGAISRVWKDGLLKNSLAHYKQKLIQPYFLNGGKLEVRRIETKQQYSQRCKSLEEQLYIAEKLALKVEHGLVAAAKSLSEMEFRRAGKLGGTLQ